MREKDPDIGRGIEITLPTKVRITAGWLILAMILVPIAASYAIGAIIR